MEKEPIFYLPEGQYCEKEISFDMEENLPVWQLGGENVEPKDWLISLIKRWGKVDILPDQNICYFTNLKEGNIQFNILIGDVSFCIDSKGNMTLEIPSKNLSDEQI